MQPFRLGIFLFTVLGSIPMAMSAHANSVGALTINIDGLQNRKGQVCLSVFSTSKGFPSDTKNAVQRQCLKITDAPLRMTLKQLQPGSYAVAVLHDENNDGKANRNFLGIPTEGFGFSQNPMVLTGPPKFVDSSVLVAGPRTDVQIQLQYL